MALATCQGCAGRVGVDRRTLCVGSGNDLGKLLRTFRRYDAVFILTPALAAEERRAWEHRLTDAYTECGCDAGAVSLVVALAIVCVVALFFPVAHTWLAVAAGGGFTLGMAIAGKIAGIAYARLRLWRLVNLFRSRVG